MASPSVILLSMVVPCGFVLLGCGGERRGERRRHNGLQQPANHRETVVISWG
jgi:hypothetical protein